MPSKKLSLSSIIYYYTTTGRIGRQRAPTNGPIVDGTRSMMMCLVYLLTIQLCLLASPFDSYSLPGSAAASSPLGNFSSASSDGHQSAESALNRTATWRWPPEQHQQPPPARLPAHFQPTFVLGARNKSINFTHVLADEPNGCLYVGANNWLLQVASGNLRPEVALKTGPASPNESPRDCSPADCPVQQPARVDLAQLAGLLYHAPGLIADPTAPSRQATSNMNANHQMQLQLQQNYSLLAASHKHNNKQQITSHQQGAPTTTSSNPNANTQQSIQTTSTAFNNNYNKILVIEPESRQLIVCGSLNQGACRRHQLASLSNYSELIPVPVASNDELASNVVTIVPSQRASGGAAGSGSPAPGPIMYVAATNSRSDLYREMVPSISARYLEPSSKSMQIIEANIADLARLDISFELRDYYLVNYVHSFQHSDYVYFATNQRKSPSRRLEEWGHISRLARLCLNDLSFQSYAEISLECKSAASANMQGGRGARSASRLAPGQPNQQELHYNLLQDAQVIAASSELARQLSLEPAPPGRPHQVLVGVFAQSKDHTLKAQTRSAICLFPMRQIEATFAENILSCLNGTSRTRNMNYIAGGVNDCPRPTAGVSSS